MFTDREQRNYFWVSHAQLVQVVSVAVVAVLVGVTVFMRPVTVRPPNATPVAFSHMQSDFTQKMQGVYFPKDSFRLVTPPVLRQILSHNLLPCEPNFLKDYNIDDCDVRDKQKVTPYIHTLENASDPFELWREDVCGLKPFRADENRYGTGQDLLPSRRCEGCSLPPLGYVLQLPFPPTRLSTSFLPQCVVKSIQIWFKGHVRKDTSAIISDAITISSDQNTIERHQVAYERLLPLNLWWLTDLPVTLYRHLWLRYLSTFLCFIVILHQVSSSLMEIYGGGQYQTLFARLGRNGLHIILIVLSVWLFVFLSLYHARWKQLVRVLTAGSPPSTNVADNAKHAYVTQQYQAFSTYCRSESSVLWVLIAFLALQILDLFTCTRGYVYGMCLAVRRLMVPMTVAVCWMLLLVLLAHAFHDENTAFRDFQTSFRTLFVSRYLEIEYQENASIHLMILLHGTLFLLTPLFLGLLMANLNVTKTLKRGRKRWWAASRR